LEQTQQRVRKPQLSFVNNEGNTWPVIINPQVMHAAFIFLVKVTGTELPRARLVSACENQRPFLPAVGVTRQWKSWPCAQQIKPFAPLIPAEPCLLNAQARAPPFESAAGSPYVISKR
jgi:hypothetical protein